MALVAWLSSLFGGLVTFFAGYIAKRLAIIAAAVTAFIGLTVAMLAAIKTLLAGLTFAAPGWTWLVPCFIPSSVAVNLSIIASAYLLRWTYDYYCSVLQMKLI